MSIVACVKVQDGIALGCDSATQITGRGPDKRIGVLKVYQNANKLFPFKKLPVGILTYGMGNIGPRSMRTLLRSFEAKSEFSSQHEYTVSNIANELLQYIKGIYEEEYKGVEAEQQPMVGMYVAGYSSNADIGEEWEFVVPRDTEAKLVRPVDRYGASWRGVQLPFTRLYFGYDPRAFQDLQNSGINVSQIKTAFDKYAARVIYDGMPVQDAINFVKFILYTTIGLNSFEIGAPSCAEPIQIAVIDEKKFQWVYEPPLTSEEGTK